MDRRQRITQFAQSHFRLVLAGVLMLQLIAMILLLSDSGAPLLLYQGF